MLDNSNLGHAEEKCWSRILLCSSPYFKSLVTALHAVPFQGFLPKSSLTRRADIKWRKAKVRVFDIDYTVLIEI